MKRKFSKILGVGLALALALSLVVMAVPVAADVSTATVTVTPTKISQAAKYEVEFNITASLFLEGPSQIFITFPTKTDVPVGYDGPVTVDTKVATVHDVSGKTVTINVPEDILAPTTVTVVLDKDGTDDILNPDTAADYTLKVSTSAEIEEVESNPYTITPPTPTIDAVGPPAANQGEVLDVYIDGANLVDGATVSFSGTGVTAVATFVDTEHLIATVTITSDAAATARTITVNTTGGDSAPFSSFTVNDAETTLVDIYDTPSAQVLLDAGWLDYSESESSITEGIAAISDEDTIIVHAADYDLAVEGDFPIMVSAPANLTIKSYMGDDYTTIDGSANTDSPARIVLDVRAAGVTIDGFTIIGSKYTTGTSEWGIYLRNTGFKVQNNTITDVAWESILVDSNLNAIALGLIHNNILTGLGSDAVIGSNGIRVEEYGKNISGVTLSNNVVSNYGEVAVGGREGNGIKIAEQGRGGAVTAITVKNNDISGCYSGLAILGTVTGMTGDEAIADNTISGCHTGVVVMSEGEHDCDSEFDLVKNTITNNTAQGIWFRDWSTKDITGAKTIKYNDIHGNGTYGILVDFVTTTGDPDARYNFWGAIGGPSAGTGDSTALGNGDNVSANVLYNPWLSVSYETVLGEGIRFYGSDTLKLEKGWNTLSVPVELYSLADSIAKIEAMGTFLTADNYGDYILEYDPTAAAGEGSWVTPTILVPCQGYYIKMLKGSSFPVVYSNSLGLPALELDPGWNLIGSAFGIDKGTTWAVVLPVLDQSGKAIMNLGVALDSISDQVSVVVSPSAPGQLSDPWSVVWAAHSTENMYTGEGYWVFMTDSGTLAGWEITPFYFEQGKMPD